MKNDPSMSYNSKNKVLALAESFHQFSEEASRLKGAYQELKGQFKELYQDLKATNEELSDKVLQLNLLSGYLHTLLSNISQGILFIDRRGQVTTYNKAAEAILKIHAKKALNQLFTSSFLDDYFGFSIEETLKSKKSPPKTYPKILIENEERHLEVHATFLKDEEGVEGILLLIRDMTQINKLQVIANRNDRMKELGEMAAMVAHEIRNPLGGIKGFASLLHRDLKDRPEQQKMAEAIIEGTDHLNLLVSRVLNYLRPLKTKLESVDLVELTKEIEQYIHADASIHQKVQFKFRFTETPFLIPLDRELFRSALFNLVVNAVQAMPEGGTIAIACEKKKDKGLISLSDTGIGIAKEHLEKIFSPFFTTKPNGTGFGLSEVFRVIQAHHGLVEVQSEINKGTTFIITIPIG